MQFEESRQLMIYHQIRPWDIFDPRVLATLGAVQRERFVPDQFRDLAFADTSIPLPCGQHMLKPVLEGRMLQHLAIDEGDRVLIVGTGSGFLTACAARLGEQVLSIDIHRELVETAAARLAEEQVHNVDLRTSDFNKFDPGAGFDRILITGSMPLFDERLPEWLKPDGKLVMIVGTAPAMDVQLITRTGDTYTRESQFETVVQPLENVPSNESFRF